MGVLRRQLWLDRLIDQFSKRAAADLDSPVRLALRLGIYQLRFLSRVPASAAVNESVNLVHRARLRSAAGLVNAVLRRAAREREADPTAGIDDPIELLSVRTSHPRWLIERWIGSFGFEETEEFANANNEVAPLAFRVVRRQSSDAEILEILSNVGATITPSAMTPGAYRISGGVQMVQSLAAAGKIYLQDEASQRVASALETISSDRILDLCAAPGSKTTQIADLVNDTAITVAGDLYHHRLQTISSLAKQQDLSHVFPVQLDGLESLPFRNSSFQRVLVDAPCSGTGTLRRNPEIRYRISPADIQSLATRQKTVLSNAASVVAKEGRLVYSTCSVEHDENEDVVNSFLENQKDFSLVPLAGNDPIRTVDGTGRTWPHRDGTDGFFIAVLERAQ